MKLNHLLEAKKPATEPTDVESMIKYLQKYFDDVEEGGGGADIVFVNRTSAKASFGLKLTKGKWRITVQGFDQDIMIEDKCTAARVVEIAKSVNKKWFKDNDPDYED